MELKEQFKLENESHSIYSEYSELKDEWSGDFSNSYVEWLENKTASAPDLLKALIESQEMIKIMLENNIGGGRHIGKTYLSEMWISNQQAINKALNK